MMMGVMVSCGTDAFYEEYIPVENASWHKDSLARFTIEIEDTSVFYQINWHLRNNDDYPYKNIYLFRKIESERGQEFEDVAEFQLADDYGKWLGRGVGELKTNTWPFKKQPLKFKQKGNYTFILQQAMRTEKLAGVEDVGLSIIKISKENGGEQ